ncbi:MAG: hypothetical protein ABL959_08720 [Pyrinomonadaceae bacterium]
MTWPLSTSNSLPYTTGVPTMTMGGPGVFAMEGSSTIADRSGNLLFFTDGRDIKRSDNTLAGVVQGLGHGPNSTQAALIVPAGCIVNAVGVGELKYFVFTTQDTYGRNPPTNVIPGLFVTPVSVVAAERPCAGECDRAYFNAQGVPTVTVGTTSKLASNVSEKLAATSIVGFPGQSGYWVVAHSFAVGSPTMSRQYLVYKVSNGTVSALAPQTIGTSHEASGSGDFRRAIGQMKISPEGVVNTKIAVAVYQGFVEILGFNRATGLLSGPPRTYTRSAYGSVIRNDAWYGLEFSPTGNSVYATTENASITPPNGQLLRFSTTGPSIVSSVSVSTQLSGYDYSQLQLGPDGKIYIARPPINTTFTTGGSVGVLNAPDAIVPGFVPSIWTPTTSGVQLGLPNIIIR